VEEFIPFESSQELVDVLVTGLEPSKLLRLFKFDFIKKSVTEDHLPELIYSIVKNEIDVEDVAGILGVHEFSRLINHYVESCGYSDLFLSLCSKNLITFLSLFRIDGASDEEYQSLWKRVIKGQIVLNELLDVLEEPSKKHFLESLL